MKINKVKQEANELFAETIGRRTCWGEATCLTAQINAELKLALNILTPRVKYSSSFITVGHWEIVRYKENLLQAISTVFR